MRLLEQSFQTSILVALPTILAVCAALLILSRVRLWYKQSHLRNIPGPPAETFAFGEHCRYHLQACRRLMRFCSQGI